MAKRTLWVIEGEYEDGWAPIPQDVVSTREKGRALLREINDAELGVRFRLSMYVPDIG